MNDMDGRKRALEASLHGEEDDASASGDISTTGSDNHIAFQSSNDASITVTVAGEPLALKRHKMSRGKCYNPSKPDQVAFRKACEASFPDMMPGPLAATIVFCFARPRSHYSKGVLKADAPVWYTRSPGKVHNLLLLYSID